jgi:hypothetical protein
MPVLQVIFPARMIPVNQIKGNRKYIALGCLVWLRFD